MRAGRLNLTIERGARFYKKLLWKDAQGVLVPLAGYTANMQIRLTAHSATPLLEFTTSNGRLALTTPGVIELILPGDTVIPEAAHAIYALEVVPPSGPQNTVRLLEGTVAFSDEVVRA